MAVVEWSGSPAFNTAANALQRVFQSTPHKMTGYIVGVPTYEFRSTKMVLVEAVTVGSWFSRTISNANVEYH